MEPAGAGGGPSQGKGHGGLSGCLSVWPCLPGTQGSEKRLPGLPVQVGTAGLSSSLLVQGQIQDEAVPSLLSG